jgi:hypothetical protein
MKEITYALPYKTYQSGNEGKRSNARAMLDEKTILKRIFKNGEWLCILALPFSDKYLDSIDGFRFLDYLSHFDFSRTPILYKINYDLVTNLRVRNLICTLH